MIGDGSAANSVGASASDEENGRPVDCVVITHEFWPFRGGVASYCAEVVEAGRDLGQSVELWASGVQPADVLPYSFNAKWLGAGTRLHPLDLIRFAIALRRERRGLEKKRIVLASVGAQMAWMLASLGTVLETAEVVVLFHGSEILKFQHHPWWRIWAKCLVDSSRVVCVSNAVSELFRRSLLGSGHAASLLAPGAVPQRLRQLALEKEGLAPVSVEEEVGGVTSFRILTLARIHPRKGHREVALALSQLPAEWREKVEYWVAGKGDEIYWQEVETVLEVNQIRWRRFGEVSDSLAAELYGKCDLFAMASRTCVRSVEGLGISYLEAGLFGKPSVGFLSGGASEAVIDGQTGLLVREGETEALSKAILALMQDAGRRQGMGRAAREHALSFSWARAARVLFDVAP